MIEKEQHKLFVGSTLDLKYDGLADGKYIYQYTIKKYPFTGDFCFVDQYTPSRVNNTCGMRLNFGSMDTELQYRVLFVKEAKTSHDFFINQLGFLDCGLIDLSGQFSPLLKDPNGNYHVLLESSVADKVNILTTDDCLRDYFFFKQRNLQLLGKPHYQDRGLAVDFNDPSGTRFILLEERDYSDA